jgi:hypothetical protein
MLVNYYNYIQIIYFPVNLGEKLIKCKINTAFSRNFLVLSKVSFVDSCGLQ